MECPPVRFEAPIAAVCVPFASTSWGNINLVVWLTVAAVVPPVFSVAIFESRQNISWLLF